METAEIYLHCEVEDESARQAIAKLLEERITALNQVKEVEATPEETQLTGVEIVAGIAVGVAVVKGATGFSGELRKFFASLTELVREVKGLKNAFVEVNDQRVPLDGLSEEQLENLAAEG